MAQSLESSQSTGDLCLDRRRFFTTVIIISPEEGLRSLPRRSRHVPSQLATDLHRHDLQVTGEPRPCCRSHHKPPQPRSEVRRS
ncbi:hypothetical protein F2Q68_00013887 [Brassica cretica]|uniref:Uncharacterized protein n=1 Tax=Brassica cretica TaxID=69181 RepID=A0A8S9H966_BRACR|nr:hypothetical protein F2Q68_00013887 [Brassica cretica]